MTRGVWIFMAIASFSSVAAQCNSFCCRSYCRCNRCSSAPCRRQRTLKDELMTYHEVATGGEVFKHIVDEEFPDRKLATCPCQSPTDSQAYYCCSTDGTTCGLGAGYPGINGLDGAGRPCLGRCDLVYGCASSSDCCSFDGFCGSTSAYCDNPMSACNNQGSAPLVSRAGVSPDAWECGGGYRNSGRCKSAAHCCSQYGYCDKPGSLTFGGDHCPTPISQTVWKQGGYVTESYSQSTTYCGSGTIGNGKCLADTTYGVPANIMCCSPNGWCGNYGNDPYGDPYCGVLVTVDTCPVCQNSGTCSSPATACTCIHGFTGTTCGTAPSTVSYYCPSPHVISSISLRSGDGLDFVKSIQCTDGSTISVNVGSPTGGGAYDGIQGPWNGYTSGYYMTSGATAGLYFFNGAVNTATYGANYNTRTTKTCPSGLYLAGLNIGPANSNTLALIGESAPCRVLPSTPAPTPVPTVGVIYSCPSTYIITAISLRAGDGLDYVKSITCSNGSTYTVNVGNPGGGGAYDGIPGPFTSYASGLYLDTGASAGVYFTYNYFNTVTYGTVYSSRTVKTCSNGQVLSGLSVTPMSSNTFALLGSSAICAAPALKTVNTSCSSNSECLSSICRTLWTNSVACDISPVGGKCYGGGDCGSHICSSGGVCVAAGIGGKCVATADCIPGIYCSGYVAGSNYGTCTAATVCGIGAYLNAGVCTGCPADKTAPAGSTSSSACVTPSNGVLGCFLDCGTQTAANIWVRDLPVGGATSSSNTYKSCAVQCAGGGYKYAGAQYGGQCYCGNSYSSQGVPVPGSADDCNVACTGDSTLKCGGACSNIILLSSVLASTVAPTTAPTPAVPTNAPTTSGTTATTTVYCASGAYITRVDLFASTYVNGVASFTCSNSVTTQVTSGLSGTAYTAISGDGSTVCPGYCSYTSGSSSNYVTQLKLTECSGTNDGTYGSSGATATAHDCTAGKRATGIKYASGGGSLISFTFLCGTITSKVSCASGFYITKIVLRASDIVYGISSFRCSDGTTQQISTGITGGTSITALSDDGSNKSVGYCAYSTGLSGSFVTQLTFTECTTAVIDGPFGTNSASPVSVACSSGKRATGITTVTGTAVTSFAFICSTIATAAPTPVPSVTIAPTTMTTTALTTVYCASGFYITRVDLFASTYVNGVASFTCSDSITIQVTSGLSGMAYTAISGDGSSVSPGYCSYTSGSSSNYVTQLKFTECSGTNDGTYGSTAATVTVHDCTAGKRATGIKYASGGGSLISFAFLCGTITKKVLCGSGFYITKIVLRASDIVYGISSFRCSDGVTQQISTGITGGTSITALSDDGSNRSVGYCAYNTGLSGSFITQLTFTECTTAVIDGPFGSNSASVTPVSVACSSGKRATGISTISGTAVTSFAFICSTI